MPRARPPCRAAQLELCVSKLAKVALIRLQGWSRATVLNRMLKSGRHRSLNIVARQKAMCGPGWAELAEDMEVRERDGEDPLKTRMNCRRIGTTPVPTPFWLLLGRAKSNPPPEPCTVGGRQT
ncbi:MAG: hypothetical protein GXY86_04685 [Firmicutes bacterium]|nr:hypothetical protein [Bacillota bacterium]